MNYPTETGTWTRPAETPTDAAMRELRAAVSEYVRRAAVAEAELRQSQEFAVKKVDELARARRIIRRLVEADGGDNESELEDAIDFLAKE